MGERVGEGEMNKKVKRAIKERLTYLMGKKRRKGSKAATTTREEDKKFRGGANKIPKLQKSWPHIIWRRKGGDWNQVKTQ